MIEVPTVRRRLLGTELRRLREAAGFSFDDAARVLECDKSKISRIETGHRGVRPKELRELLAEYGVEKDRRFALADLARQTNNRGWWQTYGDVLAESYQDFICLEAGAASLSTYEPQLVPGLLQTADYALAIASASLFNERIDQQEKLVSVRMARQQALTREPRSLQLSAILGEAALRQMVGGNEVMVGQLRRLVQIHAELPNVTLQVLPFNTGAHAGVDGGFVVLQFPEPAELGVVYVENLTSGLYVEVPHDVDRYKLVYEHLCASALSPRASIKLIEKVIRDL
jgi:transcriptional regulator with XRE-family HTH domain